MTAFDPDQRLRVSLHTAHPQETAPEPTVSWSDVQVWSAGEALGTASDSEPITWPERQYLGEPVDLWSDPRCSEPVTTFDMGSDITFTVVTSELVPRDALALLMGRTVGAEPFRGGPDLSSGGKWSTLMATIDELCDEETP